MLLLCVIANVHSGDWGTHRMFFRGLNVNVNIDVDVDVDVDCGFGI